MGSDCYDCVYAKWDYEEYYGTTDVQWFVCGCRYKGALSNDVDDYICEAIDHCPAKEDYDYGKGD